MSVTTAVNPLSGPDNRYLTNLVGVTTMERTTTSEDAATVTDVLPNSNYVALAVGDNLLTDTADYDLASPDTNESTEVYFKAGQATKIMRRETADGGVAYYWAGNSLSSEFDQRGVWQDVLRNILLEELQTDVSWMEFSSPTHSITQEAVTVTLTLNDDGLLEQGTTNRAVVLLKGNYPGEEDRYLSVVLSVEIPDIEVKSSTGVTNWLGQFIQGNGSTTSSIFQVIWAGNDGKISVPTASGQTTGDDVLLATLESASEFGRFGKGYESMPDFGLFDEIFKHELIPTTPSRLIYVRAWDSEAPESAVAYGDSSTYEILNEVGESRDFGSWCVDQVLGYPARIGAAPDIDGDSIPDGWCVEYGRIARQPMVALESKGTMLSTFGSYGLGAGQFYWPTRLFLSDSFIFVLDSRNNRVQVWTRFESAYVSSYTPAVAFAQPYGMGKDPRSGISRFAVADSENNSIRLFDFNDTSGAITEDFSFGTGGAGNGEFNNPQGVAIGLLGHIFVADTDNHRIQVFSATGAHIRNIGEYGDTSGKLKTPKGICIDSDGIVWVADTDNNRIQAFTSSGTVLYELGSYGTNTSQFIKPTDVQMGPQGRIFVSDRSNHRVQVFTRSGSTFTHVLTFGSQGAGDGQLAFPFGLMPVTTSSVVYVADTLNNRIQKFDTIIDADGDGMDDIWEWSRFGDLSHTATGDNDSDGAFNIAEYRLNLNPLNQDSDGDDWSDGLELAIGYDPNSPQYDRFRVTKIAQDATGMRIRFIVESNQVYALQVNTNLMDYTNWTNAPATVITTSVDTIITYTNVTPSLNAIKHFRAVRLEE